MKNNLHNDYIVMNFKNSINNLKKVEFCIIFVFNKILIFSLQDLKLEYITCLILSDTDFKHFNETH